MWWSILCLMLGSALVLAAIFGKHFYVGLKARLPIPAWQGRFWLIVSGGLTLLVGLGGLLGPSHEGARDFMERAFVTLDFGYEMVGGIIAVLVGVGFLLPSKEKVDVKARLFGVGAIFCGVIFITDSLWKMRR
jgi:uncharacterized membrane protein HdeD (DUF308 family)